MRATTRLSALAVAVALGLSCLLTGCGSSTSGGGNTSGGGSGGNTGGSSSNTETLQSEFTYESEDADGTMTLTASNSTIKVQSKEDGSKELNRTYYDETDDAATIREEAEANKVVQTTEKLTQDKEGNVSSVERTYVVSDTYITEKFGSNNGLVATFVLNRALAEVNELFGLDEENEGNEGNEQNEVKLYKFVIKYTYDYTGNTDGALTKAEICLYPYNTDGAANDASIKVTYNVEGNSWNLDTANSTNEEDKSISIPGVMSAVTLMKSPSVQTELSKDETEAVKEAKGTFQQVEKAKWTITKETSGSTVSYTAASTANTADSKLYLYKTSAPNPFYGWENKILFVAQALSYQKSALSTNEKGQKSRVDYVFYYGADSTKEYPMFTYYNYVTYDTQGNPLQRVYMMVSYTQRLNDTSTGVQYVYLHQIRVMAGTYDQVSAAIEARMQGTVDADVPNCATYVFEELLDSSDANQSTLHATSWKETLGAQDTIAAINATLAELYPGSEETLTKDSADADIAQAWEKYLRGEAGLDVRTEVDNALSLYDLE